MKSKTWFNGQTLVLPAWDYSRGDARVPHRSYTLADCRIEDVTVYVRRNHPSKLFWVGATGPGLAGNRSKRANTVATSSRQLAELWTAAVKSGNVTIE